MGPDTKEYYELQSDIWFNECCKRMKERDAYKKQRDELINDMAEVKRKAEAWDKLKEDYIIDINSAIDTTLYYSHPNAPAQEDMGAINILLTQLLSDLERGSDEEV